MEIIYHITTTAITCIMIIIVIKWPFIGTYIDKRLKYLNPVIRWILMPIISIISGIAIFVLILSYCILDPVIFEQSVIAFLIIGVYFPVFFSSGLASAIAPSNKKTVCIVSSSLYLFAYFFVAFLRLPNESILIYLTWLVLAVLGIFVIYKLVSRIVKD